MKIKISIFLMFVFVGSNMVYSQQTLVLDVINLKPDKISLSDGTKTCKTEDILAFENKNWIFKIQTHGNVFKIVFNQTSSPLRKALFTITKDTTLTIKDSVIVSSDFKFRSTFNLKVEKPANDEATVVSYTKLVFKNAVADRTKAGTPTGNPSTDAESYKAGFIYYDAFFLANPKNDVDIKSKIFAHYAGNDDFPDDSIDRKLKENKFLYAYWEKVKDDTLRAKLKINNPIGQKGLLPTSFSSVLSSIGGLDVTNIADGLAKFLVKRAKQELSITFFQRFKKFIDSTEEIKILFPETAHLLQAIDQEIYEYQRYIQNLRDAFKKDIVALPKNFPGIVDLYDDFFKAHKDLRAALLSACHIANGVENRVHPGDILETYPVEYLDDLKSKNYKGVIQTLRLLSASLKDTASGEDALYWVPIGKIRDLVNDKVALQLYFGLVYQEAINNYGSIEFDGDNTLVKFLGSIAPNFGTYYSQYKQFILAFGDKLDLLNKMIRNNSKPASDSMAVELYARYVRATADLFEYSLNVSKLPLVGNTTIGAKIGSFKETLTPYFNITDAVADMTTYIVQKNYSGTINKAVYIYNEVVALRRNKDYEEKNSARDTKANEKVDKLTTKYLTKLEKLNGKAVADTTINLLKKIAYDSTATSTGYEAMKESEQPARSKSVLNLLIKYGGFMATVASAKNSDDVEQAIEAFALPTGSSRIKRESPFNVSVNAYVGLYTGYEHIKGLDNSHFKFNSYGVTAPIGIAVSRGHSIFFAGTGQKGWAEGKKGWSSSLFLSVIDIGALAAFRFTNDSTVIKNGTTDTVSAAQAPAIQLKNIISPGLFLSIGIPKCPLSVNFGVQMGPNLRKVTSNNDISHLDFSNNIYWRYSISLCADIPFLNLYTRSK